MRTLDIYIFHLINASQDTFSWVIALARFSSNTLPALLIIALLIGLALKPAQLRRTVLQVFLSLAVTWCVVSLVRNQFPLPRPFELGLGTQWIPHRGGAGFPSMHSASVFALLGALAWSHDRYLALWALPAVLLVAWSRVCLGVHFPSDILAGAFTGLACARLVNYGWGRVGHLQKSAPPTSHD